METGFDLLLDNPTQAGDTGTELRSEAGLPQCHPSQAGGAEVERKTGAG